MAGTAWPGTATASPRRSPTPSWSLFPSGSRGGFSFAPTEAGSRRPLEHPGDQVGVGLPPDAADGHVDAVGVEPAGIGSGKTLPFGHGAVPELPATGADEVVVGSDPRAVGA